MRRLGLVSGFGMVTYDRCLCTGAVILGGRHDVVRSRGVERAASRAGARPCAWAPPSSAGAWPRAQRASSI
jgi:hypothetical protein